MVNFGAKILNNATSGLAAQQAVIATTGNNIANVNTPGYSRRVVDLQNRVSTAVTSFAEPGNGVDVKGVRRINDEFLNGLLRTATGDSNAADVESEFLSRVEPLFSLSGERQTIGDSLTKFFGAAEDLAANPSNIELRSNFLARADDLVNSLKFTYSEVAKLQDEADQRVVTDVDTINSYTTQIARLNSVVTQGESTGAEASDARDQRDELLRKLSEKISFTSREEQDGSVTISLSNGFDLVQGPTARTLETSKSPSFMSGSTNPPSLSGGQLSYIVFDYGSGSGTPSHVDLTSVIAKGTGEVAGLLRTRGTQTINDTSTFDTDGTLVDVAGRIEAITRTLLTDVNQTYLGADLATTPASQPWVPSSYDLNNAAPKPYGLFTFAFGGLNPDQDADGTPNEVGNPVLHPGITNYTSLLQVTTTDPKKVAAGRRLVTDTSPYPPADNQNIAAIAAMRNTALIFTDGSGGGYNRSGVTFDQVYTESVTFVGNSSSAAKLKASVKEDALNIAKSQKDENSAVSLDEEFTTLIKAQKAFQASARMIKIGTELLDQIVQLL